MAASIASEVSSICSVDKYGFLKTSCESDLVDQKDGPSPETVIRRERKWLDMLKRWDYYTIKNYKKLRARCYKGD